MTIIGDSTRALIRLPAHAFPAVRRSLATGSSKFGGKFGGDSGHWTRFRTPSDCLKRCRELRSPGWLQRVARDPGTAVPRIEDRPGVHRGELCIIRTRIPALGLGTGSAAGRQRNPTCCAATRACGGRSGQRLDLRPHPSRRDRGGKSRRTMRPCRIVPSLDAIYWINNFSNKKIQLYSRYARGRHGFLRS